MFVPSAAIISVSCTAARRRSPKRVRLRKSHSADIAITKTAAVKSWIVGTWKAPKEMPPCSAAGALNGTPFDPQISR